MYCRLYRDNLSHQTARKASWLGQMEVVVAAWYTSGHNDGWKWWPASVLSISLTIILQTEKEYFVVCFVSACSFCWNVKTACCCRECCSHWKTKRMLDSSRPCQDSCSSAGKHINSVTKVNMIWKDQILLCWFLQHSPPHCIHQVINEYSCLLIHTRSL